MGGVSYRRICVGGGVPRTVRWVVIEREEGYRGNERMMPQSVTAGGLRAAALQSGAARGGWQWCVAWVAGVGGLRGCTVGARWVRRVRARHEPLRLVVAELPLLALVERGHALVARPPGLVHLRRIGADAVAAQEGVKLPGSLGRGDWRSGRRSALGARQATRGRGRGRADNPRTVRDQSEDSPRTVRAWKKCLRRWSWWSESWRRKARRALTAAARSWLNCAQRCCSS